MLQYRELIFLYSKIRISFYRACLKIKIALLVNTDLVE
jgi:hypothetical protein